MWLVLLWACAKPDTETDAPPPAVVDVAAGVASACILDEDGLVTCQGLSGQHPTIEHASAIDGHYFHFCAITNSGVECFGPDSDGETIAPAGTFDQVSAGTALSCGVTNTGAAECWGDDANGAATPPATTLRMVEAGEGAGCGVDQSEQLVCWGAVPEVKPPESIFPEKPTVDIALGSRAGCALSGSNEITCWGDTESELLNPPKGEFTVMDVGSYHGCAIDSSGAITCWGNNTSQQASPPAGAFVDVVCGPDTTCARAADGTYACWGALTWATPVDTGAE